MRNLYKILIGCALMGSVTSCSNEQEDIFGMSSAERLNEARKRYKNNFCDSENGWVMEYFPTTSSAGVNFIMKFEESEAVNIGTQNAYQKTYAEEVSLYEVLGDYGPVLSFNSYNNLFHLFSNPEDPEGSVSLDGLGLEGDYEFIIMNVDTDNGTAHLRGKKRATDIYMHKLAAGMKWEDYFVSVQQMNERLFNTDGIPVFLKKGDELLKISYNGSNGVFVMVDEGMDYIQGTPYSFIVTGSGIRMYQPVSADGKSQNFVPNAENNKLISVENPEIYFEAYNKASAYTESLKNKLWTVDTENCGPALQAKINELITYFANNTISNNTFTFEGIQLSEKRFMYNGEQQNMQALIIRTKRRNTVIEVPFAFTTEKIGDKVKVTFPDPLVYNEIGSTNGTIFANAGVDVMFEIPTLFNGEYELTTENNFTLKDYTFVNTSENKKFTITRD